MEKLFCIATLTHDAHNRDVYLKKTVETFLENTDIKDLDWFIYCNGVNKDLHETCLYLQETYKDRVKFNIFSSSVNLGVGAGINRLNEHTTEYKYVLFLEGDWITVPPSMSGHDTQWLQRCISYLENNSDIDQILLRKYLNDTDDRQYGFGYWIKEDNIKSIEHPFLKLVKKQYTNNPYIRRNSKYYEVGIFPLNEFYNEHGKPTEIKGEDMWGQAEIQAESKGYKLGSAYMSFGNMIHVDGLYNYVENGWDKLINSLSKCKFNAPCKYGFILSEEAFCNFCDNTKPFNDLERHNQAYERSL